MLDSILTNQGKHTTAAAKKKNQNFNHGRPHSRELRLTEPMTSSAHSPTNTYQNFHKSSQFTSLMQKQQKQQTLLEDSKFFKLTSDSFFNCRTIEDQESIMQFSLLSDQYRKSFYFSKTGESIRSLEKRQAHLMELKRTRDEYNRINAQIMRMACGQEKESSA